MTFRIHKKIGSKDEVMTCCSLVDSRPIAKVVAELDFAIRVACGLEHSAASQDNRATQPVKSCPVMLL